MTIITQKTNISISDTIVRFKNNYYFYILRRYHLDGCELNHRMRLETLEKNAKLHVHKCRVD